MKGIYLAVHKYSMHWYNATEQRMRSDKTWQRLEVRDQMGGRDIIR